MNIMDDAAHWYPSIEKQLQSCSWSTFANIILERFGQEQHKLLLRQLFQLRQETFFHEYISNFTPLVDQLNAYGTTADPFFYTMCFIDGLKDYICVAISMHRPPNLDIACLLAKL